MHGTESCYATTFRKFHAILNHANYAGPGRENSDPEIQRDFFSRNERLFASRVGLWEKFASISLCGQLFSSPEDLLGNLTFHRGSIRGYIFVRDLCVSRIKKKIGIWIWIFSWGKKISIANLFPLLSFFLFFLSIKRFETVRKTVDEISLRQKRNGSRFDRYANTFMITWKRIDQKVPCMQIILSWSSEYLQKNSQSPLLIF